MPSYKLPEYSALVRWTVQDVVNWLVQIGFGDCSKVFREAGVDGSRLAFTGKQWSILFASEMFKQTSRQDSANAIWLRLAVKESLTDADLRSINCPNKRIKKLVEYLNDVEVPPQPPPVSRFMQRQPPTPVRKDYSAPNDDFIGSESDEDIGWQDDFDSDDDSDASYDEPIDPVPPPRPAARNNKATRPPAPVPTQQTKPAPQLPSRRPPPPIPQYSEDENYVDPAIDVPPRVPALPRRKPPNPQPLQEEDTYEEPVREPSPTPIVPTRRKAPSPEPFQNGDDEYEQPTPEMQIPPPSRKPPPALNKKPQMQKLPDPPTAADMGEDYEKPDSNTRRPPLPIPPGESDSQQFYDDPDNTTMVLPTHGGPLPKPPGVKPVTSSSKLEAPPRRKKQSLPEPPKPAEADIEQDVYEIPEDECKPTIPKLPGRRELPPTPSEFEDQDDYLEMDPDTTIPPPPTKVQLPVSKKEKPSFSGRNDRPKIPDPITAPPVQEETYEDPDAQPKPEPPVRRVKDSKPIGGISVLPGMRLMNSNSTEKPKQKSTAGKKRELPPPPVADEPVPEPVKTESLKQREVKQAPIKPADENIEGDLDSYPWYHGLISRAEADTRLKQKALDGMYCIRKSSRGGDRPYVLVVYYEHKIYNLPVRRRSDNKYALGAEKQGEHSFINLLEMINFFKKNYLVIHASDSGQTRLVKSLPKS